MELKFKGDGDRQKPPTLRLMLMEIADAVAARRPGVIPIRQPLETFLYDGYIYAIIHGIGGNIEADTKPGYHPCLNLKSQTVRAISLDKIVEPIKVEVHVPASKTYRYMRS